MPHKLQKWLLLSFIAMSFYLLLIAQNYFSTQHQAIAGWSALILLGILYKLQIFREAPWRITFILLAGYLAIRYILWRSTQSLIYTGPLDFIGMALLYLCEIYGFILLFLGMYVNLWPITNSSPALSGNPDDLPTVDVLC